MSRRIAVHMRGRQRLLLHQALLCCESAMVFAGSSCVLHASATSEHNGEKDVEGTMSNHAIAALAITMLCGVAAAAVFLFRRYTRPSVSQKPQVRTPEVRKNDRTAMEELIAGGLRAPETPELSLRAAQVKKKEREQRRQERRQQAEAEAAAAAQASASAAAAAAAADSEEEGGAVMSNKQAKQEAYRKRQAEREKLRAEKEAEEERKAEEKRRKEQEEYEEWKKAFEIEAEGELRISPEQEAEELERFLGFIRMRKAVELEEIAAEFGLKTKECVKRIESLRDAGRLCGVLDDRGRFLCLTEDELQRLAAALKSQGRFSKEVDLVNTCNRIIRLTPSEEDKKRIEEEQLNSMRLVQLAAADE